MRTAVVRRESQPGRSASSGRGPKAVCGWNTRGLHGHGGLTVEASQCGLHIHRVVMSCGPAVVGATVCTSLTRAGGYRRCRVRVPASAAGWPPEEEGRTDRSVCPTPHIRGHGRYPRNRGHVFPRTRPDRPWCRPRRRVIVRPKQRLWSRTDPPVITTTAEESTCPTPPCSPPRLHPDDDLRGDAPPTRARGSETAGTADPSPRRNSGRPAPSSPPEPRTTAGAACGGGPTSPTGRRCTNPPGAAGDLAPGRHALHADGARTRGPRAARPRREAPIRLGLRPEPHP